jgi:hypothetical protein
VVQEALLQLATLKRPAHEKDGVVVGSSDLLPAHIALERLRHGDVVPPASRIEPAHDDLPCEDVARGRVPVIEAEPAGKEDLHRTPASLCRAGACSNFQRWGI